MEAFQHFSGVTGLTANPQKSQAFFTGLNMDTQLKILQLTGFTKGTFPVKYLGVPLSPRKWSIADCHGLVEKITKRINC